MKSQASYYYFLCQELISKTILCVYDMFLSPSSLLSIDRSAFLSSVLSVPSYFVLLSVGFIPFVLSVVLPPFSVLSVGLPTPSTLSVGLLVSSLLRTVGRLVGLTPFSVISVGRSLFLPPPYYRSLPPPYCR